jgi:hypothetical protein
MRIPYTYVKTFFFRKRLIIEKQNPKNDVIDPNNPKAKNVLAFLLLYGEYSCHIYPIITMNAPLKPNKHKLLNIALYY